MTSYAAYNARRNGDLIVCTHIVFANRNRVQPYPGFISGIWAGAKCEEPMQISVPVDYGAVQPFTIRDLCAHYWFAGGSPFELHTRLRLFQTKTITHDPITEQPLSRPFTVFSYYVAPETQNDILHKRGCTWYGDVLVILNESQESPRVVSVDDDDDMETILEMVAELIRKEELTQTDTEDQ